MSSSGDDPKLPHDVVVEILKRLPARSLLRCRCVSRSWRSAIDHRRFVADHTSHAALDASNWDTLCLAWGDPLQRVYSLSSESQIQLPFFTAPPPLCYGFGGSCNGFICITEISDGGDGLAMHLWNPFTGKHKAVRRSGVEHQFLSAEAAPSVVGFGSDARLNDYKIVRILYFPDDGGRCFGGTKPRVEIYWLRTDSWRSLECEAPLLHSDNNKAVFLNGNLHWFASKSGDMWEEGGIWINNLVRCCT